MPHGAWVDSDDSSSSNDSNCSSSSSSSSEAEHDRGDVEMASIRSSPRHSSSSLSPTKLEEDDDGEGRHSSKLHQVSCHVRCRMQNMHHTRPRPLLNTGTTGTTLSRYYILLSVLLYYPFNT